MDQNLSSSLRKGLKAYESSEPLSSKEVARGLDSWAEFSGVRIYSKRGFLFSSTLFQVCVYINDLNQFDSVGLGAEGL